MFVRLLNHVALDLHVLHNEVCTIEAVCHDATYESSSENDSLGTFLVEELAHGGLVREVEFGVTAADEVVITALPKVVPYSRSDESAMPGNVYFCILIQHIPSMIKCGQQLSTISNYYFR